MKTMLQLSFGNPNSPWDTYSATGTVQRREQCDWLKANSGLEEERSIAVQQQQSLRAYDFVGMQNAVESLRQLASGSTQTAQKA